VQLHKKKGLLLPDRVTILNFVTKEADIDALAEAFLDLWQENIRLWAVDNELLPLSELLELVKTGTNGGCSDD
jgi:hypothetical protein